MKPLTPPSSENDLSQRSDEVIIVGRLGAPHGVRGEIHIHSYTSPVDNILDYQPWLFRRRPAGSRRSRPAASADWRALRVDAVRAHQDHFLGRIDGFPEREDVAALKGMEIGVLRQQLPDPDADEFYWRDLIGARVVDTQNTRLGVVCGLLETGVHDVLRVRPDQQGQSELLIPFVKTYVLAVSVDEIKVDWDPTWLD